MTEFIALAFYIWGFCMYIYGVAVCFQASEFFWAVFSLVVPPVGFLVGVYNWIF